jgi:hypothetical protein
MPVIASKWSLRRKLWLNKNTSVLRELNLRNRAYFLDCAHGLPALKIRVMAVEPWYEP